MTLFAITTAIHTIVGVFDIAFFILEKFSFTELSHRKPTALAVG